jgi:hypothetical protein
LKHPAFYIYLKQPSANPQTKTMQLTISGLTKKYPNDVQVLKGVDSIEVFFIYQVINTSNQLKED